MAAARPTAVTNTSPVIALAGVGRIDLLGALFERVIVPSEVWYELSDKVGAPEPELLLAMPNLLFLPTPLASIPPLPRLPAALHDGERAAITLASAYKASVLLDDAAARRVAAGLGLFVKGTLRILLQAKRSGLVDAIAPLIVRMQENGCRFSPELVAGVLTNAGEL